MPDDSSLLVVLRTIQSRGAIGEASLEQAIRHADQFVGALDSSVVTLADLGSGGGLPGLVIAVRCPGVDVTLVERRRSRADLLCRALRALEMTDRVRVVAEDVRVLAQRSPRAFDAVTARSFAAPSITARWGGELLRQGGHLIVSEPPGDDPDRWPGDVLLAAGLLDEGRDQGIRRFVRQ